MEIKKKHKLILKQEYLEELYNTYPNAFDITEKAIKINYDKGFIKLMKRTIEGQKFILDNLGVTYIGYMDLLLNSMDYDNKIDFGELRRIGIKEGMIKIARKKFIDYDIIKKHGNSFYVNPVIAVKGENINPNLLEIFK